MKGEEMRTHSLLKRGTLSIVLVALITATSIGSGIHGRDQEPLKDSSNFDIDFTNCVESIGVTLVPATSARAYVPESFTLAGEGQPVTPLVVRTAHCRGIAADGHGPRAGDIVQIGAIVVPPDFTGDINNY